MSKQIFLLLLLCLPVTVKPLIGEIVLGAVGAAAIKVATSPTGKAARWAATGYLLNTPAGKKIAALGFAKFRQVMAGRLITSGATAHVGIVRASCNSLRSYGQGSIELFKNLPKSIAGFRTRIAVLRFKSPFVRVKEFHGHSYSAKSFESTTSTTTDSFAQAKCKIGQRFAYRKASSVGSSVALSANVQNNYTAYQARGLFPRINYYHGDQGRFKFWKGFAIGSFASWTAAWCLGNQPVEVDEAV